METVHKLKRNAYVTNIEAVDKFLILGVYNTIYVYTDEYYAKIHRLCAANSK